MAGGVTWGFNGSNYSGGSGLNTRGNMAGYDSLLAILEQYGGGKSGGGLFGLGDMGTGMLMQFGGNLLQGFAGLLTGKSQPQKNAQKTFNLAQNRLGQDVIDPSQYLAEYMRTILPVMNKEAESLQKSVGLDSGVAQMSLANERESMLSKFLLQAKMQNDQWKMQNDNALLSLMGSVGRFA